MKDRRMDPRLWLSIPEATQWSGPGFSETMVRTLCRRGDLASKKVDGTVLIHCDDLQTFIDARQQ